MDRYRLINESVEAVEVTKDNVHELAHRFGAREVEEVNPQDPSQTYVGLNVPTHEGVARASEGSFIIKNERGELTVHSEYYFHKKYERA